MLLVIAKPNTNSVIYQHALYKNYQLRPSDGFYHVCLNVFNNSDKSILILKNFTLKSLTQIPHVKKSFLVLSEKHLQKIHRDLTTHRI